MKTLIELFDTGQIKNVIAGLRLKPQKIIFVGFKEVMTKKRIKDITNFLESRSKNISLEFETVGRYDYNEIRKKLSDIVERNDECGMDLTGGRELVLLAVGEVSAQYNVPVFQFNVKTGDFIKVKNCDGIREPEKASMSIEENILLNGGTIIKDNEREWDITGEFKKDIRNMWEICRDDCHGWNQLCMFMSTFEKFTGEDLFVQVTDKDRKLGEEGKVKLEILEKYGFIEGFISRDGVTSFSYKNSQIHDCLIKAGNVLELYTYMAAKEIAAEDSGFYCDIDIGVMVDWDGVTHPNYQNVAETRNEIDVVMMRDLTPIFISCKNGEVHKEALYELNAVAEKFGGECAKKVLVTNYMSASSANCKYLKQRAKDMGIEVIDGVDSMSYEKFLAELKEHAR